MRPEADALALVRWERAQIVRWLRYEAAATRVTERAAVLTLAALAIEAGKHNDGDAILADALPGGIDAPRS